MEPVTAEQILGEDGALQDDWQALAFPDDTDPHKTDQTLANIKDIRSMARQVVSGESQIGKLTSGRDFAILPNENADKDSDEYKTEVKAYRAKVGVPPESTGYKLNDIPLPEGIPKDEKLALHMEGVLHEAGASAAVAAAVHKGYVDYIKSALEAVATQEKIDDQEANTGLRKTLGATYESTMALATSAINAFGNKIDPEESAKMIKELPYDAFGTQFLAAIGAAIAETPLGQKPAEPTGAMTPADAKSEFNKLASDPYYITSSPPGKPKNIVYHDELIEKGTKLLEIVTAT